MPFLVFCNTTIIDKLFERFICLNVIPSGAARSLSIQRVELREYLLLECISFNIELNIDISSTLICRNILLSSYRFFVEPLIVIHTG